MFEYELDFAEPGLSPRKVLVEIGYGESEPGEEVTALTASVFDEMSHFVKPLCAFSLYDGEVTEETVRFSGGEVMNVGPVIASLLRNSETPRGSRCSPRRQARRFRKPLLSICSILIIVS